MGPSDQTLNRIRAERSGVTPMVPPIDDGDGRPFALLGLALAGLSGAIMALSVEHIVLKLIG